MVIAYGKECTLVLVERGLAVFAFGLNHVGQLGTGTCEDQRVPAPVVGLEGPVPVSLGPSHFGAPCTRGW